MHAIIYFTDIRHFPHAPFYLWKLVYPADGNRVCGKKNLG